MGANCEYAIAYSIPSALVQCGYAETDEVVLVTFDSITERVVMQNGQNPKISDMRRMSIKCRGSTEMHGVIEQLRQVLG
jgi:hypothetical protein